MAKKVLVNEKLGKKLSEQEYQYYLKIVHQFMKYNSHAANLEKLHGLNSDYPQYSIRAGEKARLVFIPVKHNGEQCWLWDNILPNHEYDVLAKKPNDWSWEPADSTAESIQIDAVEDPESISKQDIIYFDQQYIVLDSDQKEIQVAPTPLIISGSPGSGKTSTSFAALKYAAEQSSSIDGEKKRFLYLAASETLVSFLRAEWEKTPESASQDCIVEFKTPKQLFKDQGGNLDHLVDSNYFLDWFEDYINTEGNVVKINDQYKGKQKQTKANKNRTISP